MTVQSLTEEQVIQLHNEDEPLAFFKGCLWALPISLIFWIALAVWGWG